MEILKFDRDESSWRNYDSRVRRLWKTRFCVSTMVIMKQGVTRRFVGTLSRFLDSFPSNSYKSH
ncbi:unnamed protein product [Brassica rapa subsp. narinosa]